MEAKNHVLFAACRSPQTMVILNADDGNITAHPKSILANSDSGIA
jgi:hypothetical protein